MITLQDYRNKTGFFYKEYGACSQICFSRGVFGSDTTVGDLIESFYLAYDVKNAIVKVSLHIIWIKPNSDWATPNSPPSLYKLKDFYPQVLGALVVLILEDLFKEINFTPKDIDKAANLIANKIIGLSGQQQGHFRLNWTALNEMGL